MGKRMNLVGDVYGILTVVSYSHTTPKNHMSYYLCKCECGNESVVAHGKLRSGKTKSCGCKMNKIGAEHPLYKHGKANTKVHAAWQQIKNRCYNPNTASYKTHGAKGVTVADEFINDFERFYQEIGDPPDETADWSVDRINNLRGYEPGNIRWANHNQQARNKRKMERNSSGFTGVSFNFKKDRPGQLNVIAFWRDLEGKLRNKNFSVQKYGLLPAFKMACEYRNSMIEKLNQQGAGYTENHGK